MNWLHHHISNVESAGSSPVNASKAIKKTGELSGSYLEYGTRCYSEQITKTGSTPVLD